MSSFILGMIVGLLTGVLIAYWKQINFLYQNKSTIEDASTFIQSGQNLFQKL